MTKTNLRIALGQINTTVGALSANTDKISEKIGEARNLEAHLVVFPELAISGYPPEDLLLKPAFVTACREHLNQIVNASRDIAVIVGIPEKFENHLYNAAAVICNQKWIGTYRKHNLPNYGVFDEERYFTLSKENPIFVLDGIRFGVSICEDIWKERGPHQAQASRGRAKLLINISSSPYHRGKPKLREAMLSRRARENQTFVAYCNLVGGQDELVFDGGSPIFNPAGRLLARGRQFSEDLILLDIPTEQLRSNPPLCHSEDLQVRRILLDPSVATLPQDDIEITSNVHGPLKEIPLPTEIRNPSRPLPKSHLLEPLGDLEEIYQALMLGTRDYIVKNGFTKVVLGLSGGIDSSLVACIAADALEPKNVTGVCLPSRYSSEHSKHDAAALASNLKIRALTIPIEPIYSAFAKGLQPVFENAKPDITEENLQSRIRGTLLMALSNKFGWLVLTTGNKSEVSVGYSTLYGDMAGGFAVIKDVPKTLVYELSSHRNSKGEVIPENVFRKPPSAELRLDQKDTDSLPEYAVLDPILRAYVEQNAGVGEIVANGFDPEVVQRVIRLVDRAEYKRRQGPPGIKITERALGKDWRLPLTHHFTEF